MKWLIPGLLFLALIKPLYAQPVPPPTRQFRVISFGDEIPGLYYSAPGSSRLVEVRAIPGNFSGPYLLGDASTLEFFRRDDGGKKLPAARIDWPEGIRQGLVILAVSPTGSLLPFSAVVIDDSAQAAALKTIRFINLSSRPAAVRFGERSPQVLKPAGQWVTAYDPQAACRTLTEIATGHDGNWTVVMSRNLPLSAKRRIWVIMSPIQDSEGYDDPSNLSLRIITDRIPYPSPH